MRHSNTIENFELHQSVGDSSLCPNQPKNEFSPAENWKFKQSVYVETEKSQPPTLLAMKIFAINWISLCRLWSQAPAKRTLFIQHDSCRGRATPAQRPERTLRYVPSIWPGLSASCRLSLQHWPIQSTGLQRQIPQELRPTEARPWRPQYPRCLRQPLSLARQTNPIHRAQTLCRTHATLYSLINQLPSGRYYMWVSASGYAVVF